MKTFSWVLFPIALLAGWMAFGQALTLTDSAFVGSLNQATSSTPPTPDILWWKMDEGSGATLLPYTGSVTGAVTGATWTNGPSGATGKALLFDASGDYVKSATAVAYGTNLVTVTFWMWWDTFGVDNRMAFETSENINTAGEQPSFNLTPSYSGSSGTIASSIAAGGYHTYYTAKPTEDAWHHYALVAFNGGASASIKIYIDGSLTSGTVPDSATGNANAFATKTLNLMSRNGASLLGWGRMADFRIYSGELSAADISAIYAE